MPKSMTGFGAASRTSKFGTLSVEIRSVNNRYLDLSIRGLSELREWEPAARQIIRDRLGRGKIDVTVGWERSDDTKVRLVIDRSALEQLADQTQELAKRLGVPPTQLLGPASSLPGIVERKAPEIDARALFAELNATLEEALDRLEEARSREGETLADDLLARAASLAEKVAEIRAASGQVVDRYRERLHELVAALTEGAQSAINPERLEAEIALFADRSDISEELVRLETHLADLNAKLAATDGAPVGKPLEFLVQELLRETNTIGSKARDTAIVQTVLDMKNEIERIREQVQNIE